MIPLPSIHRQPTSPLLGLAITCPCAGVIERIGPDWDWIWIDAQHGDIDYRETVGLIRAACLIERPALVRIPAHDLGWVGKVLDAGAAGVIVPAVESVAEARGFVQAAKFPPVGNRSYGGRRVIDCLGREYYRNANRDTALILQIESSAAVALAGELAALDGVDGLFCGADDGEPPRTSDAIGSQIRTVVESCRQHGKSSVGNAPLALAKEFRPDLIVGASDVSLLAAGSKSATQKLTQQLNAEIAGNGGAPALQRR